MNRCPKALVIREKLIKSRMKYHHTPSERLNRRLWIPGIVLFVSFYFQGYKAKNNCVNKDGFIDQKGNGILKRNISVLHR